MLGSQELIAERYLIQKHLHHGYMSDVYHAYDQLLQCDVAIKLVCHDQTESRLRLQSEIHTLSSLTHDHILPILDHGEYGMYHYLVMPYYMQGTLLDRISQEILTEEEAGEILSQLTSALQFAHDRGIIHRDIKPSNILFANDFGFHVYLADFGLAKTMAAGSDTTQTGFLIGTPEYMAPELIDRPESVSTDLYSLGVLLYHMLTGEPPFRGGSPLAVLSKHVRELPIPPSHLNPAITPAVEQVILRALHKDPQQRFPDVKALAQAYMNALHSSQQTKALPWFPIFEPERAYITLKKLNGKKSLAAALQLTPIVRSPIHSHPLQRAVISLALVAMFIIPLSLGFLVGRGRDHVYPSLSAAQFANVLHKEVTPVSPPQTTPQVPTQRSTPHVSTSPLNQIVNSSRMKSVSHHVKPPAKHHRKHSHHKNDNNDANGIDT